MKRPKIEDFREVDQMVHLPLGFKEALEKYCDELEQRLELSTPFSSDNNQNSRIMSKIITKYYNGYLVSDFTHDGIMNKCMKIDMGDCNGFIRVDDPNVEAFIESQQQEIKRLKNDHEVELKIAYERGRDSQQQEIERLKEQINDSLGGMINYDELNEDNNRLYSEIERLEEILEKINKEVFSGGKERTRREMMLFIQGYLHDYHDYCIESNKTRNTLES